MRLCVAALCALLAVAAALPDTEDLPPVDEITQKLNSHEMSPQELLNMMPSMPEQYVADVKHGLSDELKQEVKEQIHASRAAVEPEPEPEPEPAQAPSADDEDSTYDYDDDFLEDDEETEDDTEDADQEAAPEEVVAEEAPVVLRASAPGLRADPVEEGSSGGGGSGSSSGGSGGVAEGQYDCLRRLTCESICCALIERRLTRSLLYRNMRPMRRQKLQCGYIIKAL